MVRDKLDDGVDFLTSYVSYRSKILKSAPKVVLKNDALYEAIGVSVDVLQHVFSPSY
jgi:hypothetical protein